jgi:hypothetical protein
MPPESQKVKKRKQPWTGGLGEVWAYTHASRWSKGEEEKTALDRRACKGVVVNPCLQGAKGKEEKTALDRRLWKSVVVDPCLQGAKR